MLARAEAHLAAHGEPLWLYVAGDSRTRGLVLYLLTLLLEERALVTSSAYKCWGVIEYRSAALRVTWHDMREQRKDKWRQPDAPELPAVRADFASVLRDASSGRTPDHLVMQFGFDLLPANYSGQRVQIAGWDYWKNGEHLLTHDSDPMPGWIHFDTQTLVKFLLLLLFFFLFFFFFF